MALVLVVKGEEYVSDNIKLPKYAGVTLTFDSISSLQLQSDFLSVGTTGAPNTREKQWTLTNANTIYKWPIRFSNNQNAILNAAAYMPSLKMLVSLTCRRRTPVI